MVSRRSDPSRVAHMEAVRKDLDMVSAGICEPSRRSRKTFVLLQFIAYASIAFFVFAFTFVIPTGSDMEFADVSSSLNIVRVVVIIFFVASIIAIPIYKRMN